MVENLKNVPNIVGVTFLLAGLLMLVFPPKKINILYGYRTKTSMKNQSNWDFSQKLASRLFMICGIVLIITGSLFSFTTDNLQLIDIIGVVETVVLTVLLFVKVESDLKNFEKPL